MKKPHRARHNRRRVYSLHPQELLEDRLALDASGVAGTVIGNDCPPDLDLSGIGEVTVQPGGSLSVDLLGDGGTVTDLDASGNPTNDAIRLLLDPDDNPAGAALIDGVLTWTPADGQTGTFDFYIIAVDAGTTPLADAEVLTVNVANQAPVVDLNGEDGDGIDFATIFTEDDGPVTIVDGDLTVTDANGGNLTGATMRITNLGDGADESLSVDLMGNTQITADYDAATGTLVLVGSDTLANYQAILRTLVYDNVSQSPTGIDRVVEISVTDGQATSDVARSTVGVIGVNDAPDLASIPDQSLVIGQMLEVTVTATDVDGDALIFLLDLDDPSSNAPAGATITSTGSNSAVIRWTPTAADGPGDYHFAVLVVDDGDLPLADREAFTVTVTAPPAAPLVDLNGALDGTDASATFTEGDGPVSIVQADLTVSDSDSATLASASVFLTNIQDAGAETLAVDVGATGITAIYNSSTGELSLVGSASAASYQQVLRTLTYDNTSSDPGTVDRIVTVIVSDGTNFSDAATATVSVVAVSSGPTLVLAGEFDGDQPIAAEVNVTIGTTAVATDEDTPSADLVFSLDLDGSGISDESGIPTLTSLAPGAASFSWTPLLAGTYTMKIVVTDTSGLTDEQAFTIVVTDPAALLAPASQQVNIEPRVNESQDVTAEGSWSPIEQFFADLAEDEDR